MSITFITKLTQFLLSLSILIIVHELGHFLFAKLFKTRIEKFYLFFNPWFSLWKKKIGDTVYGLGWLPLGGYVKISGMIDESLDKDQMKGPARPWEFRAKPAWQRLFMMLGGVLFNVLAAFLIFSMILYKWGDVYLPNENVTYGVYCHPAALDMGMHHGDKIVSLDNAKLENFDALTHDLVLKQSKTITLLRSGRTMTLDVPVKIIARLVHGEPFVSLRHPFVVGGFAPASLAKLAGLKKGDRIIGLNKKKTQFFDEFKMMLKQVTAENVNVTVLRKGKELVLNVPLMSGGMLGVYADVSSLFETREIKFGFFDSFPAGIRRGLAVSWDQLRSFKLLFSPKIKGYKSVGGFIAIGKQFPDYWNWRAFWSLTALLSMILAVMNILPIPALDGGHVLILLIEIVTRRKISDRILVGIQVTGMFLLFFLLLLINGNDLIKLIFK